MAGIMLSTVDCIVQSACVILVRVGAPCGGVALGRRDEVHPHLDAGLPRRREESVVKVRPVRRRVARAAVVAACDLAGDPAAVNALSSATAQQAMATTIQDFRSIGFLS
jgi:hypothetical protein